MASTHILTVNAQTFNVHLNYMFAGTGKDDAEHQGGALADILAVRPNDNIVFYVIGYGFYGFFKVKSKSAPLVFYEHLRNQYLSGELAPKTLTYRFFIEPNLCGVYKNGVNEWDALENPEKITNQSIYNMQWSWIFKKLKANRGCVSIPEEEYQLLKQIITVNNEMLPSSKQYQFINGIISPCHSAYTYEGNTDCYPQLHDTPNTIKTEEDLRIFFCANVGRDIILNKILPSKVYGDIKFIANEATCSFGEKRIDLLFITDQNKCLLIELKNNFDFSKSFLSQIAGYARWIASYKRHLTDIIPILVLPEPRSCPAKRQGYKFKYLSQDDRDRNIFSPWYKKQMERCRRLISDLHQKNVPKLADLKVVLFHTTSEDKLQRFTYLDTTIDD